MAISDDIMYRQLVQNTSEYAIYMMDADGVVLNWNAGAERAKGYTAAEIVGKNFGLFYSEDDRLAGIPQRNLAIALRDGRARSEGWRYRKDGTAFWASITITAIYETDGSFLGFAKITRDLTEQHEMITRIEHQATHDALTGLLNRSGLLGRLDRELRSQVAVAVYYLDLDRFKSVNDSLGHRAGDIVLREVGRRITDAVGGRASAGRLGGDEFAIVVEPSSDLREVVGLSRTIVDRIGAPIEVEGAHVTVGASIGVARAPDDGSDTTTLLRNADVALYRTKEAGRNCVRVFGAD